MSRVADAFPPVRLAVVAALAAPGGRAGRRAPAPVRRLGVGVAVPGRAGSGLGCGTVPPDRVAGAAPGHGDGRDAGVGGRARGHPLVARAAVARRSPDARPARPVLGAPGPRPAPGDHLYLAVAVLLTVAALAGRTGRSGPRSPARAATGGAGPYAVVVAVLAGGAFGFWLTAGGPGRATGTAAAVLVAACPAAVALAVPAAHLRAARRGAQLGVRVR